MFSLPGISRWLARHPVSLRPPSALGAATARSFSASAPSRSAEDDVTDGSLRDVADMFEEAANAQVNAQTPGTLQDSPLTQSAGLFENERYFRPFYNDRWISPFHLSVKDRTATKKPIKPMLRGPTNAESRRFDVFHQLNIDPLYECQNSDIMSRYVTEMGKIKGRALTGLTWKSQRRLGKAIRRAKKMGIIPVFSRRKLNLTQYALKN